jgi:hypothetical protein
MDTPDIESLVGSEFDSQSEPTPAEVEPTAEVSDNPEPPQEVQEVKTEESDDSFTKVDLNALTDNEKKIYKQFQADYTRKRQKESAEVKKLEKLVEELKGKPQVSQNPELSVEDRVKQAVRSEQDELWDKQAQADYPSLDPRANEDDPITYDEFFDATLRKELTEQLDAHVEEHGTKVGFDYRKVTKEFTEKWDKYIEGLNKAYVKKQTQLAKENADKLKKQAPVVNHSDGVKTEKMNLTDAIEEAFNES